MRDKLEKILSAYADLEKKLADPAVVSDPKEYARIAKEHADQAELVELSRSYIDALDDIEAAKEILRRISDKMYFITRLYVADHEQARKVEQAGLKKVFSNLKEVTNSEWFECWAAEIVRKEAIAHVLPLKESTTNSNMYTEADEIPNYMAVLPETVEGKKYQV